MLKGTLYAVMLTGFGAEVECLVGRGVCVTSGCLWLGFLKNWHPTEDVLQSLFMLYLIYFLILMI